MVGSALLARRWRAGVRPVIQSQNRRAFNTWTTTFRSNPADETANAYIGKGVPTAEGPTAEGFAGTASASSSVPVGKVLVASVATASVLYAGLRSYDCSNEELRTYLGPMAVPASMFGFGGGSGAAAEAAADSNAIGGREDWDAKRSGNEKKLMKSHVSSLKSRGFNRSASGRLPRAYTMKKRAQGFYLAVRDSRDVEVDVVSRRYREDQAARSGAETDTDMDNYVRAWHNPVENRFERLEKGAAPPSTSQLMQYYTRKNRVFDRSLLAEDELMSAGFVAEEVAAEATVDALTVFVSEGGALLEA